MKDHIPKILPIQKEIETTKILKKLISANCVLEHCESVNVIVDSIFRGEL